MSCHTKAGRRASLRAYCILGLLDGVARHYGVDPSADCMCRFRGGCGGLGVVDCRGCGGDCCICTCGGETECFGCEDCDIGDDDGEMWTEDYDDHAEAL